ncbi:nucleoside diphosphate kinase regulator [Bradyrhizobium sp.]|uniref:nucleoside diphosphate kinase regulator n=1 Tax=Bradyrhizobium sp. TaxID=376 RepID=UPI002D13986B|nr:nucleoside diphosphate kinase regulator [Bradyrhizobium sp.]HMM88492.1 nucleoside diphosphate kinase regulator [Bradyrhizobium sp.]
MSPNTRRTEPELPPIHVRGDEMRRLRTLANSSMDVFPRVATFLMRELDRASVMQDDSDLPSVVRMGSQVSYRDEKTDEVRDLVLVYPHEADISHRRISVLTPVGAALIGMSVGQAIEFQTPGHVTRKLTVLRVSPREEKVHHHARKSV